MQPIPPRHAPRALAYANAVISNSDAGCILGAYIASILKGIMRTGFMPCNVRRAPDEAMHCQAHSLDADQLDKKPRGQSSPTPGAM
jgi:hypothetical protein